jgi:hypothetical protein
MDEWRTFRLIIRVLCVLTLTLMTHGAKCDIVSPEDLANRLSNEEMLQALGNTWPMTTTIVKQEVDMRWAAQCLAENHPAMNFLFDLGQAQYDTSRTVLTLGKKFSEVPLNVKFEYCTDIPKTSWTLDNKDLLSSVGISVEEFAQDWVFVQDRIASEDVYSPLRKSFQANSVGLKQDVPVSYEKVVSLLTLSGINLRNLEHGMKDVADDTVMEIEDDKASLRVKDLLFVAMRKYSDTLPGHRVFGLSVAGLRDSPYKPYNVGPWYLTGRRLPKVAKP